MKNTIIAVLITLIVGVCLGMYLKPSKTTTVHKTDTLKVVEHDTFRIIITKHGKTKTDTLTNTVEVTDTTEIQGYLSLIKQLYEQQTTDTKPDVPVVQARNWNVGLIGGASYGLKDKDISPILSIPIRYRHVYFMPFTEYNKQFRLGAGVGITF